jgi:ERCC4-type nuclease
METSRVTLTIDMREAACIAAFPDAPTAALDIGDMQISFDGQPTWLFERKSLADLSASITDGRYKEQKLRYLAWRKADPLRRRVFFIIEGYPGYDPTRFNTAGSRVQPPMIIGSVINTQFRDDISIVHTKNPADTNAFLGQLLHRVNKDPGAYFSDHAVAVGPEDAAAASTNTGLEYANCIKMKRNKNITPDNVLLLQLGQIPGISAKIASAITAVHPTMAGLIRHLDTLPDAKARTTYVCDLPCPEADSGTKARRVGPKTAANIIAYLYGA